VGEDFSWTIPATSFIGFIMRTDKQNHTHTYIDVDEHLTPVNVVGGVSNNNNNNNNTSVRIHLILTLY